ncbi:MAG: hypothetical protein RIB65_14800 [Ilumatobacter fluminis]|uniref:hypothetical protein n=1 Tax=Ilumatobacter fluminis TaxID=467091 RepID=UPI0032F07E3C
MDIWLAAAATLIALISLAVSIWSAIRSHSQAERSARDSYLERMRDWADETVEIVVGLNRLCRQSCLEETFMGNRDQLRTRLSAQIEKGRWFFPNLLEDRVGERKQAAYRGLRQPILDHLVDVYNCVDSVDWLTRAECQPAIRKSQRGFVSEVQLRLDPKQRDNTYQDLLDRYEAIERLVPVSDQ